jgi:hypothetical protein
LLRKYEREIDTSSGVEKFPVPRHRSPQATTAVPFEDLVLRVLKTWDDFSDARLRCERDNCGVPSENH